MTIKIRKTQAHEYLNDLILVSRIIYWSSLIFEQTFLDLMEKHQSQH